jgi:microcystin-dependent protein
MIQTAESNIIYFGNASTSVSYPIPFLFFDDEHIYVVVRDPDGVETPQVLGTDFTLTGAGNPAGGSMKTTWEVPATSEVTIYRLVPYTQLFAYEEGDAFPAKSHEKNVDLLTMECQQNARLLGVEGADIDGRAFRLTEASGGINAVSKKNDTTLGITPDGKAILRTPEDMLNWMGFAGSAWADDSERMGTRGAYPGQLGVQLDNWAIYEARTTAVGDWQPFLRFDGIVTSLNGVVGGVPLPVGDIVGTDESQILYNKTLYQPSIIDPTGLDAEDVGLGNVDNTSDEDKPVSLPTLNALLSKQDLAERAQPNGYATLDGGGKLSPEQIPDASLVGAALYKGTWNASTNSPAIAAAAPANNGWYYIVSVAGTTTVDGISSWAVGDKIISNGAFWQKVTSTQSIISVNGKTGVVVLDKNDIGLGNVANMTPAQLDANPGTLTNKTIRGAEQTLIDVRLGSDVSGNLPVTRLNAGTGASPSTWWCGDGSWKRPPGTGDVAGQENSVSGELTVYEGPSGKIIGKYTGPAGLALIEPNQPVKSTNIHDQDLKPFLVDDDEFLIWDSVTGTLKRVRRGAVGNPVGTILDFAGDTPPADYLLCYGQLVSKTTYAALYAAIGDLWGTGNATDFKIPDLRGYVTAGQDDMGGTSAARLSTLGAEAVKVGGAGGLQTHVLTTAQLAAHAHNVTQYYNPLQYVYPNGALPPGQAYSNGNVALAIGTANAGSNQAHNNIQPTRLLNKIIRF